MKKRIFAIIAVIVCFVVLSGVSAPVSAPETTVIAAENPELSPVETRFLNMLNHNFVYGEDFGSFDAIATGSILSMLSSREGDYISETYVKGFANDMYGINIVSFGEPSFAKHKEGYVYIPPMGYTKYLHTNISASANEDGSYTVLTDVTVSPHDSESYTASCTSLFAKCDESPFGYILVFSDIAETVQSF